MKERRTSSSKFGQWLPSLGREDPCYKAYMDFCSCHLTLSEKIEALRNFVSEYMEPDCCDTCEGYLRLIVDAMCEFDQENPELSLKAALALKKWTGSAYASDCLDSLDNDEIERVLSAPILWTGDSRELKLRELTNQEGTQALASLAAGALQYREQFYNDDARKLAFLARQWGDLETKGVVDCLENQAMELGSM